MQQPSQQADLESLLNRLDTEYYAHIILLCDRALLHIAELHDGDVHQTASLYTSLSKKLIGQVEQYVRLRRYALLPYLIELMDKEDAGHDCRDCGSSCTIRHSAQIVGITRAHNKIKETLYRVQSVAIPLLTPAVHAEAYLALRNDMMQLDTQLTHLFYLEETCLMPAIIEAQKNIHAHK